MTSIELDIDGNLAGVVVAIFQFGGLQDRIFEIGQSIRFPRFLVFIVQLPFYIIFPCLVGSEEIQLFRQGHIFEILQATPRGRFKGNTQTLEATLHLVVFAAPTPIIVGILQVQNN